MQTLSSSEAATTSLPELFAKARATPLIVNDAGCDLGAIVSMEDFEIIRKSLNEKLLRSMDDLGAAMRQGADTQGISMEDLEKMLDRHSL